MKKSVLLCLLFIFSQQICYSQQHHQDSIIIKKNRFYKNDSLLQVPQIKLLLAKNEAASKEFKKALNNLGGATALGFIGGALIGFPIGQAISSRPNNEPKWYLAGIGAGVLGIAITLNANANKHAKNAVEIYNGGLKNAFYKNKSPVKLNFALNFNGIGVSAKF